MPAAFAVGVKASRITLMGDSAGGALVLAAALRLQYATFMVVFHSITIGPRPIVMCIGGRC